MTEDPRKAEALRLWRAIHTVAQIADRLEVGETTVRRWLDPRPPPPSTSRGRAACSKCGRRMRSNVTDPVCATCQSAARHERAQLIERLWAEGRKAVAIGAELGWSRQRTTAEINVLRKCGYNLPRRYRDPRRATVDDAL